MKIDIDFRDFSCYLCGYKPAEFIGIRKGTGAIYTYCTNCKRRFVGPDPERYGEIVVYVGEGAIVTNDMATSSATETSSLMVD